MVSIVLFQAIRKKWRKCKMVDLQNYRHLKEIKIPICYIETKLVYPRILSKCHCYFVSCCVHGSICTSICDKLLASVCTCASLAA